MRPTDLHFRSPKEKTAEFLHPQVTSNGQRIPLIKKVFHNTKGSFPRSSRFPQYYDTSRKTGFRVGPGAYNLDQSDIEKKVIKGTPQYHKSHVGKNWLNNGYIYVGQSIAFDPGLMNKSANVLKEVISTVDATQVVQKIENKGKYRKSIQETNESSSGKEKNSENGFKLSDSFFRRSNQHFTNTKNSPKF